MLWIVSKYPSLENDFVVMGDSAGANIAAVAVIIAANPSLIEYLGNAELSKQKVTPINYQLKAFSFRM